MNSSDYSYISSTEATTPISDSRNEINIGHLTLCCITVIFATIGNGATLAAFIFDPKTRLLPHELIIVFLAFTDLALALSTVSLEILVIVKGGSWPLQKIACHLTVWLGYTLNTAGTYFIVLLSWDRYCFVSINYLRYLKNHTHKKQLIAIGVTFLVAAVPGTLENALWNLLTPPSEDDVFNCIVPSAYYPYFNFALIATYSVIPIFLVGLFGVLYLVHLRRRLRRWRSVGPPDENVPHTAPDEEKPKSGHNSTPDSEDVPDNAPSGHEHKLHHDNESSSISVNDTPRCSSAASSATPNVKPGNSKPDNHDSTHDSTCHDNTNQTDSTHPNEPQTIRNVALPSTSRNGEKMFRSRYIKPAVTFAALVFSLVICTLPLGAYSATTSLLCPQCFDEVVFLYLIYLAYFKSCVNPAMHFITQVKIRQFYKRIWRKI